MLKIVKAITNEKDTAMGFINEAKKFLKESGVDQWQNGYPDEESIENDIMQGKGYFIDEEGDHIGYMCIDFNGEPAYEQLCGNWLNEEKYIVIHRMAMSVDGRGKGLAQKAFELAGELALANGVSNIRVDTDSDNMIMKHILNKCGFTYCGTIWFDNSEKIAFQKSYKWHKSQEAAMRYEDILEKAKSTMQSCNVCPICNGIACAGHVPGPGGKGSGSTAIRNYNWWRDHVKLHLDVVKEPFEPDTSTKILGMELTMPVMAAPIGMVGPNFSHSMDEYTYAHAVVAGAAAAGTIAFTGGGPTDDCFFDPLKAINELGIAAIPTLKPWKLELVAKRMKSVEDSSAVAVAMDIDSAGLPHSSTSIEPVMAKSPSDIRCIKEMTKLPFIVKGVMTAQSAEAVADAGVDAIVVSNHGGRVLDEGLATGEVLAEIKKAVGNRTKVLVDGGIRTGADVYKALALGADAVLVGRPVAIAAFGGGEKGVNMFFEKIRSELKNVMKMTGAQNITNITENTIKSI